MKDRGLDILNSEGPILILERSKEGFKLNFNMQHYKIDITKEEIINFINGKLTIKSKDGTNYNYLNHSMDMRVSLEKVLTFIG